MSSPDESRGLIPHQRNGEGPDTADVEGVGAVDDRVFVRVVNADFDMGAWFDARTPSPDTETRCI